MLDPFCCGDVIVLPGKGINSVPNEGGGYRGGEKGHEERSALDSVHKESNRSSQQSCWNISDDGKRDTLSICESANVLYSSTFDVYLSLPAGTLMALRLSAASVPRHGNISKSTSISSVRISICGSEFSLTSSPSDTTSKVYWRVTTMTWAHNGQSDIVAMKIVGLVSPSLVIATHSMKRHWRANMQAQATKSIVMVTIINFLCCWCLLDASTMAAR